jgi:hypothetical protein
VYCEGARSETPLGIVTLAMEMEMASSFGSWIMVGLDGCKPTGLEILAGHGSDMRFFSDVWIVKPPTPLRHSFTDCCERMTIEPVAPELPAIRK